MLDVLRERKRDLLKHRSGIGCRRPQTLQDASAHIGIRCEPVRQIEAKAMAKLRHPAAGHDISL